MASGCLFALLLSVFAGDRAPVAPFDPGRAPGDGTPALTADCNGNGVDDSVDIAVGSSGDLDRNGIPDECEAGGDGPAGLRAAPRAGNSALGRFVYHGAAALPLRASPSRAVRGLDRSRLEVHLRHPPARGSALAPFSR